MVAPQRNVLPQAGAGAGRPLMRWKAAWERFIALVQCTTVGLQFVALDLFSEMTSPGGYRRALARGRRGEGAGRASAVARTSAEAAAEAKLSLLGFQRSWDYR